MPSTATVNRVSVFGDQYTANQPVETIAGRFRPLNAGITFVCVGDSTATDWENMEGVRTFFVNEVLFNAQEPSKNANCILRLSASGRSKNFCFRDREVFAWDLACASSPSAVSEVFRASPVTVDVGATIDPSRKTEAATIQTEDMLQSLAALSAIAKAVIPELRDMTPNEKKGLKQYYKSLYRKV
jgi:hypothetical protein